MKVTLAFALLCVVGVTACSTQHAESPAVADLAATAEASCGCGHKAQECGCAKCKATKGASCECSKGSCGHKAHVVAEKGHSCSGH